MSQTQQVPPTVIEPMLVHAAGWYALQGGGERFWDGADWADYEPTPYAGSEPGRFGTLDAGAVIAGLVPIAFLVVIIVCAMLLHI